MKKKSKLVLILAIIPIASAVLTMGFRYAEAKWFAHTPRLECPQILDLGEQDSGTIAVGHFRIRNGGTSMLTAKEFSTTCACAGVERENDGHFSRVKSVELSPGEEIDLTVRMSVGVRPGESQSVFIVFQTNDPAQPMWEMAVVVPRVSGGYFADPSAVVFGPLVQGEATSRTIDLYDNRTAGRRVERVRVMPPDRFTATLLPLSDQEQHQNHATAGKLIARVRITPYVDRPGHFDGEVEVSLANETYRIQPIPVIGEVVSVAECRPSSLVLPRRVGGSSVHTGDILIFNRHEKPIDVVLDSPPSSIAAQIQVVPQHPDQRLLRIERQPTPIYQGQPASETRIRVRVRSEGVETKLEVPIFFAENQP